MRNRRTLLAGIAACATALAAPVAASADSVTYTTPGLTTVTLPAGVASVHVVAIGGRGGGVQGGYGAVVTADVSLSTATGVATQILVYVGGNGRIGRAGTHGGGGTAFPSLAGGGGGSSNVDPCTTVVNGSCTVALQALVAGGGGGAGADGLPGTGGAGGSAGLAGGPGSATALLAAATGGSAGIGGSGGISSDPNCGDGDDGGVPPTSPHGAGGDGGTSGSLDGHGDGGGGGGGNRPNRAGGGGGAGAWCLDDTGASGAGGAGGGSFVPSGGQLGTDTTGVPSVTLTYTPGTPSVTIATPADGAVYAQGSSVTASFACVASSPAFPIASCNAPVASGNAIDTASRGLHTFSVNTTDAIGMTSGATVQYSVTDQTSPAFRRLRIVPSEIDAASRRSFSTVHFRLSEAAQVQVSVRAARHRGARRRGGRRHGARSARGSGTTISGRAGANSFRLHARIGRRVLQPGAYQLTLVAVDAAGNRSSPVTRGFSVVDSAR